MWLGPFVALVEAILGEQAMPIQASPARRGIDGPSA
jgi:hypothetical protein